MIQTVHFPSFGYDLTPRRPSRKTSRNVQFTLRTVPVLGPTECQRSPLEGDKQKQNRDRWNKSMVVPAVEGVDVLISAKIDFPGFFFACNFRWISENSGLTCQTWDCQLQGLRIEGGSNSMNLVFIPSMLVKSPFKTIGWPFSSNLYHQYIPFYPIEIL